MKKIADLKIDEFKNNENYLFNECIDWFNKYLDTYDSFRNLVRKREDLGITTTISKEKIEEKKSKYLFSINLTNTTIGQHILEGPSISIDSKNKEAIHFLMTAITIGYLSLNQDFHMQLLEEDGLQLENEETHNSTLDILEPGDKTLWLAFIDIVKNKDKPAVLEEKLFSTYQKALEKKTKIDDDFCKSIDDSDQHHLAVKRYFHYKKRR